MPGSCLAAVTCARHNSHSEIFQVVTGTSQKQPLKFTRGETRNEIKYCAGSRCCISSYPFSDFSSPFLVHTCTLGQAGKETDVCEVYMKYHNSYLNSGCR